jgi:hypothetical protein
VKVPGKYEWIVDSIRARRPTEAGQARLVIAWLVAFLAHLGLLLEEADGSALAAFCHRASLSRTDASMNRLVFTIRNVYAELHSRDWVGLNPASDLRWTFCRQRRCTLDIDLGAVQELLEHIEYRRFRGTSEEEVRNRCCVHVAVDAGLSCSELSGADRSPISPGPPGVIALFGPSPRPVRSRFRGSFRKYQRVARSASTALDCSGDADADRGRRVRRPYHSGRSRPPPRREAHFGRSRPARCCPDARL